MKYSKNWHGRSIKERQIQPNKTMTLLIFISATLLTFGIIEVKDAIKV